MKRTMHCVDITNASENNELKSSVEMLNWKDVNPNELTKDKNMG